MDKISYFYNEIQFYLLFKSHLNWRFEILGVDKQMFISCDQDEPYRSPKKAYFSPVIGIYFLSFFYVDINHLRRHCTIFFSIKILLICITFYLISAGGNCPNTGNIGQH